MNHANICVFGTKVQSTKLEFSSTQVLIEGTEVYMQLHAVLQRQASGSKNNYLEY